MKKIFIVAMVTLLGFSFVGVSTVIAEEDCDPGTGTPGYWMNHPDAWPIDGFFIGEDSFTQEEAIRLMRLPVKGDKTLTLFPAYVAALLNVQCGNDRPPRLCEPLTEGECPFASCDPLGQAHDWLDDFEVLTGIKGNNKNWQESHGESIYLCLDDYNNGLLNVQSRDALE